MRSLARNLAALAVVLLLPGCAMLGPQGATLQHPDFDTELLLQVLDDVDYLVTNYAWLLALLGLG